MITLDLGCGDVPRGPSYAKRYGVDIVAQDDETIKQADLVWEPIPYEDKSFDRVYAYDFLQFIPMKVFTPGGAVNVMESLFAEVHRVLNTGGVFESFTPHLPHLDGLSSHDYVSLWAEGIWDNWDGFEVVNKDWQGTYLYVELVK